MSTRTEKGASVRTYRNFIGGEWVEAETERTVPNLNPADTREVMGWIPLSSIDDARRAVAAARAASSWPRARATRTRWWWAT